MRPAEKQASWIMTVNFQDCARPGAELRSPGGAAHRVLITVSAFLFFSVPGKADTASGLSREQATAAVQAYGTDGLKLTVPGTPHGPLPGADENDILLFDNLHDQLLYYINNEAADDVIFASPAPPKQAFAIDEVSLALIRITSTSVPTWARISVWGTYDPVDCDSMAIPVHRDLQGTVIVNLGTDENDLCDTPSRLQINLLTGQVYDLTHNSEVANSGMIFNSSPLGYIPAGNGTAQLLVSIELGRPNGSLTDIADGPSDACDASPGGRLLYNVNGDDVLVGNSNNNFYSDTFGNNDGSWDCDEFVGFGFSPHNGVQLRLRGALGEDCNTNAIVDEFETVAGLVPDCNNNRRPDSCDIAGGRSVDVNSDGIPDECVQGVSTNGVWSNAGFWSTAIVPNNTPTNAWSVTLGSAGDEVGVDLDIPVEIDTLRLLSGAQVEFSSGDLSIANSNGIRNDGLVFVNNGRSLIAEKTFLLSGSGDVRLAGPDAYLTASSNGLGVTNRAVVRGFGVVDAAMDNRGTISADTPGEDLVLASPGGGTNSGVIEAVNGGIMEITSSVSGAGVLRAAGGCGRSLRGCTPPLLSIGTGVAVLAGSLQLSHGGVLQCPGSTSIVSVSGVVDMAGGVIEGLPGAAGVLEFADLRLASSSGYQGSCLLTDGMTLLASGNVTVGGCGDRLRGCTPPLLAVHDAAWLKVDGMLALQTESSITVDSSLPVVLGGDFGNQNTDPSSFDWANGGVQWTGSQPQSFEVAGMDLQASIDGFANNFAIGSAEVAAGADVTFVNSNGNTVGTDPCVEALYVDELILGGGATVRLDNVRVYSRHLIDEGAAIVPIGCGALVVLPTGDYDGDGTVDLADFVEFGGCISGPGEPYASPVCGTFDFNMDGQLDLADFAAMMGFLGD